MVNSSKDNQSSIYDMKKHLMSGHLFNVSPLLNLHYPTDIIKTSVDV